MQESVQCSAVWFSVGWAVCSAVCPVIAGTEAIISFTICLWYLRGSAVQYSSVQCRTLQYSSVQCSTVQYSALQYSTVQCSTVQYTSLHKKQLTSEIWSATFSWSWVENNFTALHFQCPCSITNITYRPSASATKTQCQCYKNFEPLSCLSSFSKKAETWTFSCPKEMSNLELFCSRIVFKVIAI